VGPGLEREVVLAIGHAERTAVVPRVGDPATLKSVKRLQMKTPFALPANPVEAAQVAAKFWQAVELLQVGAEVACWRQGGRLFRCQIGYRGEGAAR
jgi:hypothetical protein